MKRVIAALALLAAWAVPGVASAHPLGNFTVNHYARLQPASDRIHVVYVLDMAEIPTFQEKPRYSPDPSLYGLERAREIGQNLSLSVDGQPTVLRLDQQAISFPEGAGGLPTLRLEAGYSAEVTAAGTSAVDITFRDDNDPARIGWREIVARPGQPSVEIQRSSVPAEDVTNELRQYPEDLLNSPLNVRSATLTFLPADRAESEVSASISTPVVLPGAQGTTASLSSAGSATTAILRPSADDSTSESAAAAPADDFASAARPSQHASPPTATAVAPGLPRTGVALLDRARSTFAELAKGAELTPAFIIFAVGVALVLGAAHALQPGHGKTIVAAYLIGSRGTARHAMFLGATVTATHTAGVYALGIVTLFLSQYILPERLYPMLEVVSGVLVVAIGVWLFGQRLLAALGLAMHGHRHGNGDAHDHSDEHDHEHGHAHTLRPGEAVSWKSLLALGVSGGLLPCPEALMVLLITIAAHRVLFGLLLIVSFSTGLAAVLVGFGLLLVYARGLFARVNPSSGLASRLLPVGSAVVIVVAGGVITAQALPQVL